MPAEAPTVLTPGQLLSFLHKVERTKAEVQDDDHLVSEVLQSVLFNGNYPVDVPTYRM